MLTETQRDRLLNRDKYDSKNRAYNDYGVAKKLKAQFEELQDIYLVLNNLPTRNLKRVITDETVSAIFSISEKILEIMDYLPIQTDSQGTKYITKTTLITPNDKNQAEVITISRLATEQDLARNKLLQEHIKKLSSYAFSTIDLSEEEEKDLNWIEMLKNTRKKEDSICQVETKPSNLAET